MKRLANQRRCLVMLGGWLALSFLSPAHAMAKKASSAKLAPKKQSHKPGALPSLSGIKIIQQPPSAPVVHNGDVLLYDGQPADEAKITAVAWGGGAVEDSGQVSFSGGHSLKVTTLDPYQGAQLVFQNPVALGTLTDPARFLVLTLRLTADRRTFSRADLARRDSMMRQAMHPAPSRWQTGGPRVVLAQYGQMSPPGLFPPRTSPLGQPSTGAPSAPSQGLTQLHLVFTLANGAQADTLRVYPNLSETDTGPNAEQWVTIGIPLATLHFSAGTNAPLQSITLGGDDYAVFYIGQIKLTRDTTPITCFAKTDDADVAPDTPVTLHGSGDGGASALVFSWDFDASDGITDQAQGQTVTTQYSKGAQDYTATLTVSDQDGLKKPATATVAIHVQ